LPRLSRTAGPHTALLNAGSDLPVGCEAIQGDGQVTAFCRILFVFLQMYTASYSKDCSERAKFTKFRTSDPPHSGAVASQPNRRHGLAGTVHANLPSVVQCGPVWPSVPHFASVCLSVALQGTKHELEITWLRKGK
jgi:hypothetical protein